MFCDQCGEAALSKASKYCYECGTELFTNNITARKGANTDIAEYIESTPYVSGRPDEDRSELGEPLRQGIDASLLSKQWGKMLTERGFNPESDQKQLETLFAHFYNMGGIEHDDYDDVMAFALHPDKFKALKKEMFVTNNIFFYASKELSTDAFLAWLFVELEKSHALAPHRETVFSALGMIERGKTPNNIRVKLQDKRVDILLSFEVDGVDRRILFENKVWTSFHSGQLYRYKNEVFKDCHKYIYLKLGFLDAREKDKLKELEYSALSATDLHSALAPLSSLHPFILHYCEFLKFRFIDKIVSAIKGAERTDLTALKGSIAQKYLMGILYDDLKGTSKALEFKAGSNVGGGPWTQLYICKKENIYDDKSEVLFWRIDHHSGKPYIRLSQYSRFPKGNKSLEKKKKERLKEIREFVVSICEKYSLVRGKVRNRGIFESEVVIFFFEDNSYEEIKSNIPKLTREIQNEYSLY